MNKKLYAKKQLANVIKFIKDVGDHAIRSEEKYGILAEVLVAQAALETGWGSAVLRDNKGSSNNLFNIKKGSKWEGAVIIKTVHEYSNGKKYYTTSPFRRYKNYEESFNDYCELISKLKIYKEAYNNRKDPKKYLEGIHKGGYATDPKYVSKILAILKKYVGADVDVNGRTDEEIVKEIKTEKKKSVFKKIIFWKK